ncbi:MAG: hypothetical protein HZB56_11215 [Deltaproteobacteria bacterium]|nr:hypothetical protein [Deltaproteobacteria bacterium]
MRTLALLLALCLAPAALAAEPTIPVRVRILKGSRQGPPALDPRLADLAGQLGKTAYQRWEQVAEETRAMAFKRQADLALPGGETLQLVLEAAHEETVTIQVKVPARKTQSRITISKTQRIVHQVTDERGGEALFVSIRPWP